MHARSPLVRLWLPVVAIAVAAAGASAQTTPGTSYSYDNNGNLHGVATTCGAGSLLCTNMCVPSDAANCGACGKACPGVKNGYATCSAPQCGLACNAGYQMSAGTCQLIFSGLASDIVNFPSTYSATYRWSTGAPATTSVRYRAVSMDATTADDWTVLTPSSSLTTSHVATLTDLYPVANYQIEPMGTDSGGSTFTYIRTMFETPRGQYDVGVISYRDVGPWATTCPAQKNLVRVYLDAEDSSHANASSGWIGGIGNNSQGMFLPFCRIDGRRFRPLVTFLNTSYEYAVLALSDICPVGSVPFWRFIDAEDDGDKRSEAWADRANFYTGQEDVQRLRPNYVDGARNVRLNFCMFRFSETPMGGFPDLSQPYGVFAPADFMGAAERGWVFSDDENASNRNNDGSPYPTESRRIVSSGVDTTFNLARVALQPSCTPGLIPCAGSCVDLATSALSCGACGSACSTNHIVAACAASSCNPGVCAAGWADCNGNKRADGCETSLLTDESNCGTCGKVCPETMECISGRCRPPVQPPECTGVGCP